MPKQSYKEYREAVKEEQGNLPYNEVKQQMEKRAEYLLELDNLQPQSHNWIDRGLVMSCENGGHGYHQVYKRIRS